jgi:hypothetical protein
VIRTYILEGTTPVPCADLLTWGRWFEARQDYVVARTTVAEGCEVSTVFLGLDHDWTFRGPPLLFETMVFWEGRELDQEQARYATYHQAEQGHEAMVARVQEALDPRPGLA